MKRKSQERKQRSIKSILGMLLLLSSTCLVSVGLSAWSFGGSLSGNGSAGLDVGADGRLVDINSYIQYGDAQIFDFCKDGLILDDTIVTSGDIVIPFSIVLDSTTDTLPNHLPNGATSFSLSTVFTNKVAIPTLLNQYLIAKDAITLNWGISANSLTKTETKNRPASQTDVSENIFTINEGLNGHSLYFSLKYSFTFPMESTFKTQIYDKLSTNGYRLSFNFKAEVQQ